MRNIYLDNAAATPIDSSVLKAMNKATALYANPSSFNNAGRAARAAIEKSRKTVAAFLGARPDEVVFTGSGSEANNLAILGTLSNQKDGFVLTTPIEHRSVVEPFKKLGLRVVHIPIDQKGLVDVSEFEKLLKPDCRMVSVMYANNEIGTIEPIVKIGKIIKEFRKSLKIHGKSAWPIFHVDACQAAMFLDMNVRRLGVDLLSFDGCKIYGPHGIGVLYISQDTKIRPLIVGAGQEHGLKAGTENILTIIGLGKAISLIEEDHRSMVGLRNYSIEKMLEIPGIILNGPTGNERLPNNINIAVEGLSSELLLLELDKYGIAAGSGSACTSRTVEPSRVLKSIGIDKKYLPGALRFSMGRQTTKKDMDYVLKVLPKIISDLKKRYGNLTLKFLTQFSERLH